MTGRDGCGPFTCSVFGKQVPLLQWESVREPRAGPEVARWDQAWREPVFRPLTSGKCVATRRGVVGGRGGCVRLGVFCDLLNTPGGDVIPISTAEEAETQRASISSLRLENKWSN